jgi:hypothetical protein
MIIVGSYESPEQAHVVLGRLHAEEIPAALLNEYAIGNQWGIGLVAGGVRTGPADGRGPGTTDYRRRR